MNILHGRMKRRCSRGDGGQVEGMEAKEANEIVILEMSNISVVY